MTTKAHVLHLLSVAVTTVGAILVPALSPGGALAHYAWSVPALAALVYVMRLLTVPPTSLLLLVGVTLVCGGATCRTLGPVPPGDAGTLTDCSDAALHSAELALVPSVENALALADYASVTAALGSLVGTLTATVGAPLALAEVTCAVDWIASKAQHAPSDKLESSKANFGARWVAEHGATVKPAGTLL